MMKNIISLAFLLPLLFSLISSCEGSLPFSWKGIKKFFFASPQSPSPNKPSTTTPSFPIIIKTHETSSHDQQSSIQALLLHLTSRILTALISYFTFQLILKQINTTITTNTEKLTILHEKEENITLKFPDYIPYFHNTINTTLNYYEQELLMSSIQLPPSIQSDWKLLGGLQNMKKSLWQIVSLQKRNLSTTTTAATTAVTPPSPSSLHLFKPVKSILFYGPPGCGKSALVQGLAKRLNWPMMTVTPSGLLRKYVGETSLLTKAIFTLAKKFNACIIFIDEMDSLFRARNDVEHQVDRNLMTEFMQLWDNIVANNPLNHHQILIVGATNRPQDLDPAIQRRFERSFLIGFPDHRERVLILKKLLSHVEKEKGFDFDKIAKVTEGFCSNDLLNICKAAILIPLREKKRFLHQQHHQQHSSNSTSVSARPLKIEDVMEAISSVPPSSWNCKAYGAINENNAGQQGSFYYDPNQSFQSPFPTEELDEEDDDEFD